MLTLNLAGNPNSSVGRATSRHVTSIIAPNLVKRLNWSIGHVNVSAKISVETEFVHRVPDVNVSAKI